MQSNLVLALAFHKLPTFGERSRALHALVNSLGSYDWRELNRLLGYRDLRYDLIGNLPLELTTKIFHYLDPVAPFYCQSVSKTWHAICSSTDLINSSLNTWYLPGDPPLKAQLSRTLSDSELQKIRLEHLQRFRNAKPTSWARFSITKNLNEMREILINSKLSYPRLSWVSENREIKILNLVNGQFKAHSGPARERINEIAITNTITAGATSNSKVYVWTDDDQRFDFRLPAPLVAGSLLASGYLVTAIVSSLQSPTLLIVCFDTNTRKSSSFQLPWKRGDVNSVDGLPIR
jgi:hypothetical protein